MKRFAIALLGTVTLWGASGCCCGWNWCNPCGQQWSGCGPAGCPTPGGYNYPATAPSGFYTPYYTSQVTTAPAPMTAALPSHRPGVPLATASLAPLESLPTY
jgi:hypothetical protein